jgi:RNA polymerase sigma factor (sigma-70 family)
MDAVALYKAHREAVERVTRRVAQRYRLSRDDADDFRQDAWLYLLRNNAKAIEAFRGQSAFETYLWKILSRRCARLHSRQVAPPSCQIRSIGLDGDEFNRPRQRSGRHEYWLMAKQLAGELDRILTALPVRDREVLWLHFIRGIRLAEIAERRKCSHAAMYKRVERLLFRIRVTLVASGFAPADAADILSCGRFGWSAASLVRERMGGC